MSSGALLDELVEQLAGAVTERVVARLEATLPDGEVEPWRLLSVDEIGERLGRSRTWGYAAVRERGLPQVHLDNGGGMAFDLEDVKAWAKSRRVPEREEL